MNARLYHRDVSWNNILEQACKIGQIALDYSEHARRAANSDRYGKIVLPAIIDTVSATAIEAEVTGNKLTKVVYRLPYSSGVDICIVVVPQTRRVKTVWLNRTDDKHSTLNASKYCRVRG